MIAPQAKQDLLAYLGTIQKDIESGADYRLISKKIRKSLRMVAAAEAGVCPYCGMVGGHKSPTSTCTSFEIGEGEA
jgi:hypothetical protein